MIISIIAALACAGVAVLYHCKLLRQLAEQNEAVLVLSIVLTEAMIGQHAPHPNSDARAIIAAAVRRTKR